MSEPKLQPQTFVARAGRLRRLIRKELAESLRDRRTVLTLLLMPILLYPLLTIGFQQFVLSRGTADARVTYRIGYRSETEARFIAAYLTLGEQALAEQGVWQPAAEPDGKPAPEAPPHTMPMPALVSFVGAGLEQSLKRGELEAIILPRGNGRLELSPERELAADFQILYRAESGLSLDAVFHIRRLILAANERFLAIRLQQLGEMQRADPVRLIPAPLTEEGPKKPHALASLIPLILILMTITGAVYPAIDLTAGERERGTMEILVAAPIPRLSVLFAKYVAVLTVAMLTAGINLLSMTVTLLVTGIGAAILGPQGFTALVLIEVIALLLLFAAFFSAVLLSLTSFARSFKEAQAYLIPLMLLSLAPGMVGLIPGLELGGLLAVAPLLNVVLLARDLIQGVAAPAMAAVVVVSTLLYAVAALAVAARLFGAEAVFSSESSGWGDLFRRSAAPRDTVAATSALLCLALMFPAYFLLNAAQAQVGKLPMPATLALGTLANVILFVAMPAVVLWQGRVRLSSALALRSPSAFAVIGGVLLGVSLWPITLEIGAFLRSHGVTTIPPAILEKVRASLDRLREVPAILPVLVLGVLGPLLEELFFRGLLFGAIQRDRGPGAAIALTAVLFGVFHLFLPGAMALERVVTTALMGVVLGWVRWQAGSVWPGAVLHVLHNSVIVLLGYYQPALEVGGWLQPGGDEVPAAWLFGSLLVALLGAALTAIAGRLAARA